jgi:hypothetical protein
MSVVSRDIESECQGGCVVEDLLDERDGGFAARIDGSAVQARKVKSTGAMVA